jgi:phospholipase/carboxylesterase
MGIDSYIHRVRPGREGGTIAFAFHGTGGDENQFLDFAGGLMPEATIVSPRGDVSEGGALRFFRRTGEGVYDIEDLTRRTAAMAAFVRAQRDRVRASRVVGLGYSNGANILASMMLSEGDLFDAALLMHPLIPWSPADQPGLAGKAVMITAGRRDPICPAPLTEALAAYLTRQGAATETVWHPGGHEIQQNEIAAAQRFFGGG